MAWTKFDNKEEKKRLQERALALKPKQAGVIATELGWATVSAKGTLEILVRYDNLDELLGDEISEVEQVGEPLVIAPETVVEPVAIAPVETPVVTEEVKAPEVVVESPKVEEAKVEAPVKKKGGRPPKPKAE
jgi:hypothetical protein